MREVSSQQTIIVRYAHGLLSSRKSERTTEVWCETQQHSHSKMYGRDEKGRRETLQAAKLLIDIIGATNELDLFFSEIQGARSCAQASCKANDVRAPPLSTAVTG